MSKIFKFFFLIFLKEKFKTERQPNPKIIQNSQNNIKYKKIKFPFFQTKLKIIILYEPFKRQVFLTEIR